MAEESYFRLCLRCGGHLSPVATGPTIPPWMCEQCNIYYWVAELVPEARQSYRYESWDYGEPTSDSHRSIRAAVDNEMQEASHRGVSIRREQLGLISKESLKAVMATQKGRIHPDFEAHMKQQTRKRVPH